MNRIENLIEKKCKEFAANELLIENNETITYSQFYNNYRNVQELIQEFELEFNGNFSIVADNSAAYLYFLFAYIKNENTAVNLNPNLTNYELLDRLERGKVRLLIISKKKFNELSNQLEAISFLEAVIFIDSLNIDKKNIEFVKYNRGVNKTEHQKEIAFLQFTGGTTGISKAAIITHENVIRNLEQLSEHIGKGIDLKRLFVIIAFPFYHIFSVVFNFLFFFRNGGTCVLNADIRNTNKILDLFDLYPVNFTIGVNTWYNKLMQHADINKIDFSSIRASFAGGEYVPVSTKLEWQKVAKKPLYSAYGLTETTSLSIISSLNEDNILDAIGIPIPQTEAILLDENNKTIENDNVCGELALKGPQVTSLYFENDAETSRSFYNGWFKTGDLAMKVENGNYKIVDRQKDMISVSGNKVYPNEVEEVIRKLDGIVDVSVVGRKSKKSGEEVVVCIVLDENSTLVDNFIIDHCKEFLSKFKVPKEIIRYSELPKTAIGKTARRILRDNINE